MKLVYPVVLYPSGVPGGYTVLCPDMPGLVTEGRNLPEALDMAVDAASGWVLGELEEGRHEPHATNIADVKPDEPGGIVTLISLDIQRPPKRLRCPPRNSPNGTPPNISKTKKTSDCIWTPARHTTTHV